ncbi:ngep-related [Anaeramoeba flamelloides]|uniref:Ngep-related n=1 Tax=Anaeramoeba flamelloides TaxID=1746091 RepID=A0ABQ8X7U3_9EUKA|nr:ngep-related [Anaeramoeba flamelloides]
MRNRFSNDNYYEKEIDSSDNGIKYYFVLVYSTDQQLSKEFQQTLQILSKRFLLKPTLNRSNGLTFIQIGISEQDQLASSGEENKKELKTSMPTKVYEEIERMVGTATLEHFLDRGEIKSFYALHSRDKLKKLYFFKRLLDPKESYKIYDYFGSDVSLYYDFLRIYNKYLIPLTLYSILVSFFGTGDRHPINSVVSSIFISIWCWHFISSWGMIQKGKKESANFYKEATNIFQLLSNKLVNKYNNFQEFNQLRAGPMVLVATSIISFLMLLIAAFLILLFNRKRLFQGYEIRASLNRKESIAIGMRTAITLTIFGEIFRRIAQRLVKWERPSTNAAAAKSFMRKTFLFEFVTNMAFPLASAFFTRDSAFLSDTIAWVMITRQFLDKIKSISISFLRYYGSKWYYFKKSNPIFNNTDHTQIQFTLDQFQGSMPDQLQLMIQLCFVCFFVVPFPLASFFALINNYIQQFTYLINFQWRKRTYDSDPLTTLIVQQYCNKIAKVIPILSIIINFTILVRTYHISLITNVLPILTFLILIAYLIKAFLIPKLK